MEDFLLAFLTSVDFVTVDQPLFTAIEFLKTQHASDRFPVHDRVWISANKARQTTDLSVKKAWWLVCCALFEPIQQHVIMSGQDPAKNQQFVEWLKTEVPALFEGKYSEASKPLSEFVASSIACYCSL